MPSSNSSSSSSVFIYKMVEEFIDAFSVYSPEKSEKLNVPQQQDCMSIQQNYMDIINAITTGEDITDLEIYSIDLLNTPIDKYYAISARINNLNILIHGCTESIKDAFVMGDKNTIMMTIQNKYSVMFNERILTVLPLN